MRLGFAFFCFVNICFAVVIGTVDANPDICQFVFAEALQPGILEGLDLVVIDYIIKLVIDTIYDYMDISKHQLGEDIYVGDIIKEIMKVDGVINLTEIRIFNEFNGKYSLTQSTLPAKTGRNCDEGGEVEAYNYLETNRFQIDIDAIDGILYADSESMFEIKFKDSDIRLRCRER